LVAHRAGNCFGYKIYTHSKCAAATGTFAGYKTYASDWPIDATARKVVVSTATAGTFNAIFEVTAKGGTILTKTVAITVKTCSTTKLIEPSAADYIAALSTIYMNREGWKDYTLPVWTTDDTNCPIDSYKLLSTSDFQI
jgi:hypothetical protein